MVTEHEKGEKEKEKEKEKRRKISSEDRWFHLQGLWIKKKYIKIQNTNNFHPVFAQTNISHIQSTNLCQENLGVLTFSVVN